jgi:hypothetical protein
VDLTARYSVRCWKCEIELLEPDRFKARCPRCACDLSDAPIDLAACDPERRRFWRAALDLAQIWKNWGKAYKRVMNQRGEADYSMVHDFCTEVTELSFPYIGRLKLPQVCMEYLRDILNSITDSLLQNCMELERVQLLTGQWSEFDEDVKQEWLGKLGFTNHLFRTIGTEQKRIGPC